MTKKDFIDLLIKFEQGKCSKEEETLLFSFYESFQHDNEMDAWDLQEKELAKTQLLSRIDQSIEHRKAAQRKKINWSGLSKVAAIFIGLIGLGYMYIHNSSPSRATIPNDAITLELQDGSVMVIQEMGKEKVLDENGNVIGEQKGNQLAYTESLSSKELVYNTLTVPYGKTFDLLLSDGTKAYLNAGSSLKYPVKFLKSQERKVFVTGEVFLDVKEDRNHPFIVSADNLNIRVLGTQFNVQVYPEEEVAEVVLVEGAVALYSEDEAYDEGTGTKLEPGFKASFDKTDKKIETEKVITNIYTSWMNGELIFRNMSFNNILKKLERQYNVKFINRNKGLSSEKFNASFGNKPLIKEVLEELKTMYQITYTIEGGTITID